MRNAAIPRLTLFFIPLTVPCLLFITASFSSSSDAAAAVAVKLSTIKAAVEAFEAVSHPLQQQHEQEELQLSEEPPLQELVHEVWAADHSLTWNS